jgi:NTP pyrophosphatase (non-canonical NTP hydrolase)
MTFDEYQTESNKTAQYPKEFALYYCGLGLTGEAGEVAEKIKKIMRNDNGVISEDKKIEIKKEIGDVLWYAAQLATVLEISFEDVAQGNLDKLFDRMDRGVLKSQGDNR